MSRPRSAQCRHTPQACAKAGLAEGWEDLLGGDAGLDLLFAVPEPMPAASAAPRPPAQAPIQPHPTPGQRPMAPSAAPLRGRAPAPRQH